MFRALNTAATGMTAMQTNVDVIANNMANANTTGFRRSRAEFQDLIYQTFRAPGGQTGPQSSNLPTGVQVGLGTRNVSMEHIHLQGALQQTGNPLDLAIEGDGFFQVIRPDGSFAYTRAGNLKADAEGRVVTVDGYQLEPAVVIPPDAQSVTVSPTGIVSAVMAGETTAQEIGRIELVNFLNPAGLEAIGRAQYVPTDASGAPLIAMPGEEGNGTLLQGMLEGSNVEVVNEMIRVGVAKMFIGLPGVIRTYDHTTQKANVQPVIRATLKGGGRAPAFPVIPCVPVLFPSGGGFSLTWPLKPGDFVQLQFADRSIAEWLTTGQNDVTPSSNRRFALSDAVAIPSLRPFSAPLTETESADLVMSQDDYDGSGISNDLGKASKMEIAMGPRGIGIGDLSTITGPGPGLFPTELIHLVWEAMVILNVPALASGTLTPVITELVKLKRDSAS